MKNVHDILQFLVYIELICNICFYFCI